MNATSIPSNNPHEFEDLAWLLPEQVESEPPSGRYLQIEEFVMSRIQQDLQSAPPRPGRASRRRVAYLTSALAATAAIAGVAVAVVSGSIGSTGTSQALPDASSTAAVTSLSGQQILLAAATTAERLPDGAGSYWYVKVVSESSDGKPFAWETWNSRDGQTWFRGEKSGASVVKLESSNPFVIGGAKVSYEQIQALPTEPAALKASIDQIISNGDVRTSGGNLTPPQQEQAVFESLISLVSQLPAPQQVRAAAFRAIAGYPNVTSLGQVDGGLGLKITFADSPAARLVIDPERAQVRQTNFYVSADGAIASAAEGGVFTLTSEWTDTLPK